MRDTTASQPDLAEAKEALSRVFGFSAFRPGQEEVVEAVLAGENVLAIMPTGAGKSLLYQLPAVLRPGLSLVVSPLIALMRDQVQHLRRHGIAAASLNSANTEHENRSIEAAVANGRTRLLYLAPERLVRPATIALLREANVSMLAIDEAHCVSEWGHDFRPEYLDVASAARAIGELQIVAVTATADATTRAEIIDRVFPAPPRQFIASFDRPNIRLAFERKVDPVRQIERMIARHKGESGIVYCATRKGTERLSEALSVTGIHAFAYHAGLDADRRSRTQDEFLSTDGTVIVATIAFGMGVDKPDVRFVCHADLPGSVEAYYHETGRAGRDGLPADTLALFGKSDIFLRERKISEEGLSPFGERERRKLEGMIGLCEAPRCRRQTLLAAFGETIGPCGNCDLCERRLPVFNEAVVAVRALASSFRRLARPAALDRLTTRARHLASKAIMRYGQRVSPALATAQPPSPAEWRSILYQLRRAHLIMPDPDDEERWAFTEAGLAVLAGTAELTDGETFTLSTGRTVAIGEALAEIEKSRAATPRDPVPQPEASPAPPLVSTAALTVREHRLLAALKARRRELAKARKVAACQILPDTTLVDMARTKPASREALLRLPSVDPRSIDDFGTSFLEVVSDHDAR